ncbi:VTT domain-containing protein [Paenibacillus sp. N3.4]|uniref:VTT domain-containing protein n=1 Tax=Paenibacillus sp. N3.4 TaxID=2603222 RepID=UPI0011C9FF04|nr:VTT domain-containing protein [Paenibacillus sp. N3.4]TXK74012.1 alkaline phosphatase [Paenibacillus sp. N3.4]
MLDWVIHAFQHYGYVVLFLSLLLELLALPLPGEILMSSAGLLVYQGKLSWLGSIAMGGLGASLGMTFAYTIGYKLGMPFVHKYGKYVHFGPSRLNKTSEWFSTYGNKLLAISYFIPGVRHFIGYFAGIVRIPFRSFALYAYTGAFLWVGVFITLGKLLGPKWKQYHHVLTRYMLVGVLILCVFAAAFFLIRRYRSQLVLKLQVWFEKGFNVFHSFGRVKFIVVVTAIVFLGVSLFTIGLIQDYLAQEFDTFDEVVRVIMASLTADISSIWAKPASYLVTLPAELIVCITILLWIVRKGKDKLLEIFFLGLTVVGGEVWGEVLTGFFHRLGSPSLRLGTYIVSDAGFPSEPTLSAIILYGYAGYMLFRHTTSVWLKTAILPIFIIILFWVGCNDFIYANQHPSDIVAGFSFGGVWISLQILLLEIFRMLRQTDQPFKLAHSKKRN